jgi:hypothetical protein
MCISLYSASYRKALIGRAKESILSLSEKLRPANTDKKIHLAIPLLALLEMITRFFSRSKFMLAIKQPPCCQKSIILWSGFV